MPLPIYRQNVPEWKLPYSSSDLIGIVAKGLEVPEVWTAEEFALQGRKLINALARIAKLTERKAVPVIARTSAEIFRRQLDQVIRIAQSRAPRVRKPADQIVEILLPSHRSIWMQAIEEVFAEQSIEATLELVPPIQSVMAQGYSRTSILLGQEADPERNPAISRQAQEIARKITRIDETTREKFRRVIDREIEQGQTIPELAKILRTEVMDMTHARSMTIARTETNGAFTRGSAQAFKESETLTHVSVIGCTDRETDNQWQYRGESTCGIQNVSVTEIDALLAVGWHPNHQGTLVPSGFRQASDSNLATLPPSELFR